MVRRDLLRVSLEEPWSLSCHIHRFKMNFYSLSKIVFLITSCICGEITQEELLQAILQIISVVSGLCILRWHFLLLMSPLFTNGIIMVIVVNITIPLFSVYFVLKFGLASFRSLPVVYMIMQSFLISSTTFLYRATCLNIFILLLVFYENASNG